jgi:ribosomal protein S27AE
LCNYPDIRSGEPMPKFFERKCPRCGETKQMYHLSQVCAGCRIDEERNARRTAKGKAWSKATKAIKSGKLDRLPCEVCGAGKVDAHHDDYSKPLEIRWLCRSHHKAHHYQFGPGLNA